MSFTVYEVINKSTVSSNSDMLLDKVQMKEIPKPMKKTIEIPEIWTLELNQSNKRYLHAIHERLDNIYTK